MICEHLRDLEKALASAGVRETFRGAPWSDHCREWVYFDIVLDVEAIAPAMPACVRVHENTDPRSGLERGFVCAHCHDAVMGRTEGAPRFPRDAASGSGPG